MIAVGSVSDSIVLALSSSPIKDCRCYLEQVTLFSLPSTGWLQEQIGA